MSIDPILLQDAEPLVLGKARKLSRRRGFSRSDVDDIGQEQRTHLIQQAAKYDPTITTWEKFVSFILDKRCISLHRQQTAEKRSPRREECSLNDSVRDADGRMVDRHQTTPEATRDFRWLMDLRADLDVLRQRVSEETWLVARGLGDGNLASIAREQGWSRATADRHMRELRQACEDLGLREYLRPDP